MTNDAKLVWLVSFSHFITHGYMTILPAVLIAIATEQSISFTELGIIANVGYFLYGLRPGEGRKNSRPAVSSERGEDPLRRRHSLNIAETL